MPGVVVPKPKWLLPPGVDIIDDGNGVLGGGVDGGPMSRARDLLPTAGDGEVARNISKSAASSFLDVLLKCRCLDRAVRAISGEDWAGY